MCGVIGFTSKNVNKKDIETIKRVMIESSIRGKHASGIAWVKNGEFHSMVDSIPIDELVNQIDWNDVVENGCISMIAHARYSTSDIKYNQPIVGDELAIVHNGVITQSPPETWEKEFEITCKTKNDSELLLHCYEQGNIPKYLFPDSSIAAILLDKDGTLYHVRNKLRPMWVGKIGFGTVYASTLDILNRAGVEKPQKIFIGREDLQVRRMASWSKIT